MDRLLSCGGDSVVYVHHFDSEKQQKLVIDGKSSFSTIATFDQFICAGDDSGNVYLYHSEEGVDDLKLVDSNTESHAKYITVIAFSESFLVSCSNSGSVVVSKGRESLDPYRKLGGHTERVNDVAFCPSDETLIVTASMDGTCQIWSIESGCALANYDGHS